MLAEHGLAAGLAGVGSHIGAHTIKQHCAAQAQLLHPVLWALKHSFQSLHNMQTSTMSTGHSAMDSRHLILADLQIRQQCVMFSLHRLELLLIMCMHLL